jgi:hypothetical protein
MTNPTFTVEYEGRGQNSWERRMYAQGRLVEDMKHEADYSVSHYAVDGRSVFFAVKVDDELALTSDYFGRAVDASRQ